MRRLWTDAKDRLVVVFDNGALCAYDDLNLRTWYDGGDAERRQALWDAWTGGAPSQPGPVGGGAGFEHHGDAVVRRRWRRGRGEEAWIAAPTEADYEGWVDAPVALLAPTMRWSGPPGPWSAEIRLRNPSDDRGIVVLAVPDSADVRVDRGRLDDHEVRLEDGCLTFARAPLQRNRPARLALQGRAAASSELRIDVFARAHAVDIDEVAQRVDARIDEVAIGTLTVELEVTGAALGLVRGATSLPLDPSWVAALSRAGALDLDATPPDLGRWLQRALTRCRVASPGEDPDGVLAEWLRLTARDRSATGRSLPAYKLSSGQHWVVAGEELARIRDALGPEHPMSRFAEGGPFEVVGPDPLATLGPDAYG